MEKNKNLSIRARGDSIGFALEGIIAFFKAEHNALLHLLGTLIALTMSIAFNISRTEWIAIIVVIGLVWVAELFNTVIEKIMDHISPDRHPDVKAIKDMSAGAVLLAAFVALITGCIIFFPKF